MGNNDWIGDIVTAATEKTAMEFFPKPTPGHEMVSAENWEKPLGGVRLAKAKALLAAKFDMKWEDR